MASSVLSRLPAKLFAERWTPLIVRELFAGSRRFSEIRRGMPLISRALLTQRLRHLEDVGVIESHPAGRGREYRLSQAGAEFHGVIEQLGAWGSAGFTVAPRPRISTQACSCGTYAVAWRWIGSRIGVSSRDSTLRGVPARSWLVDRLALSPAAVEVDRLA